MRACLQILFLFAALTVGFSAPEKIEIPTAGWVPIYFSRNNGIDELTEKAGLKPLREMDVPAGSLEVRFWYGFSFGSRAGILLRRDGTNWKGRYIAKYYDSFKTTDLSLGTNWQDSWAKLESLGILTLPDSSTLPDEDLVVLDGISYVVEINDGHHYRTYHYSNPSEPKWPEAKQINEIRNLLGLLEKENPHARDGLFPAPPRPNNFIFTNAFATRYIYRGIKQSGAAWQSGFTWQDDSRALFDRGWTMGTWLNLPQRTATQKELIGWIKYSLPVGSGIVADFDTRLRAFPPASGNETRYTDELSARLRAPFFAITPILSVSMEAMLGWDIRLQTFSFESRIAPTIDYHPLRITPALTMGWSDGRNLNPDAIGTRFHDAYGYGSVSLEASWDFSAHMSLRFSGEWSKTCNADPVRGPAADSSFSGALSFSW